MKIEVQWASVVATWHDLLELTKPLIVALIVVTSVVGSLMAAPGLPRLATLLFANLGMTGTAQRAGIM
jgi:protoheme IX farnesyltransferase